MESRYTHLIWDFNGTLLCDMQAGIDSTNILLSERGLDIIPDVESYRARFDFPVSEYYRGLGFDFKKDPYDELARVWVGLYLERVKQSSLSDGVIYALEKAKELGVSQIVLSASESGMLKGQLSELGIIDYFEEIIGLDNVRAGSKLSLAEQWRGRNSDARALMVGDTLHDADAASLMGADCLLYSRGHQSRERLTARGIPIIDDLKEVALALERRI